MTAKHTAAFEVFWIHYPKRTGKQDAKQQFRWALTQTDSTTIIDAAKLYAKSVNGKDKKYLPAPGRWLGEARWDDEVELPKVHTPKFVDGTCFADHTAKVHREADQARANLSRLEPEELAEARMEMRCRYGWAIPVDAIGDDALQWPDGAPLSLAAYLSSTRKVYAEC